VVAAVTIESGPDLLNIISTTPGHQKLLKGGAAIGYNVRAKDVQQLIFQRL